jgi:hypothetical protein
MISHESPDFVRAVVYYIIGCGYYIPWHQAEALVERWRTNHYIEQEPIVVSITSDTHVHHNITLFVTCRDGDFYLHYQKQQTHPSFYFHPQVDLVLSVVDPWHQHLFNICQECASSNFPITSLLSSLGDLLILSQRSITR